MESKVIIGLADAAQIAAWKKKFEHGIFHVKKDGRIAYFKMPSFTEIDAYLALVRQKLSASEEWKALTGMLHIGGDKELIESPKYLGTVARKVQEAMNGEEAELVNL
jgi:hypothetical protein